jgi:hypothetical protein
VPFDKSNGAGSHAGHPFGFQAPWRILIYCISNRGGLSKICCAFNRLWLSAERRMGLDFSSLSGYFAFIHRIME